MTIDEAIKELEQLSLPIKTKGDYKKHTAVTMGIVALKAVKVYRTIYPLSPERG